ncbi:MAG: type II secretion system protein GspN [Geobacteraceae bacterium]|nr:type II secretion system protein GspN [Geobacteraceae bacterium]
MKLRRPLYIGAAAVGALFLIVSLTLFFIPDRELQALATRALQREGYTLRAARFGKAFPLGVRAAGLELADERGPLLKADKATVSLALLPLLTGKITVTGAAAIGAGHVTGEYSLRDGAARIEMGGIRLEDLPFIETATGARAKGVAALQGSLKGKGKGVGGELKLEIRGANVAGVKIGEIPLPDADYTRVQGVVRAGGGMVTLGSFTLEGEGLYVRLKGDLPLATPPGDAPLNLTLELMPKPEFQERQKFVFILLTKYLTTPGHYQIPIRGTLAKPVVQ